MKKRKESISVKVTSTECKETPEAIKKIANKLKKGLSDGLDVLLND